MLDRRRVARLVQPPVSLVAPAPWTPEEKRLVQQIDSVFKDVYRRWGRLGLSDFSVELRQAFGRTITIDEFESIFRQTAESLSVQFGTPGELHGPQLEVSRDRLYARVPEVDFVIVGASGNGQIARFHSQDGRFVLERLTAQDIECPVLLRWDRAYGLLATNDKTVFGAILELKNRIDALEQRAAELEQRVHDLENPPEEGP